MIITYEYQGRVHDIEFDTVMRRTDVTSSAITAHPVEKGSPVNDHIRQNPDHFTVEASVTNTPIVAPTTQNGGASASYSGTEIKYETTRDGKRTTATASVGVMRFDNTFDRVRDVYGELKLIQDNGLTVMVRTMYRGGITDYDSMGIANLSVPQEVADGSARTFTFEMQKLRIVETKKVTTPKAKKTKKHKGEKGKTTVDDSKPKLESIAKKLVTKFLGAK